jgi:hypothetical protein
VAIGVGVGIGLSVALLVFAGGMWFIRRQKEEGEEEEEAIVSPPNYTMSERPPLKEPSPQYHPEQYRQELPESCSDGNVKNRM